MSLRRGDLITVAANGLREPSDVMADKVLTVPRPVVSLEYLGVCVRKQGRR